MHISQGGRQGVKDVYNCRKVNSLTKSDSDLISRIDDCLDSIERAKFITKIDLLEGHCDILPKPEATGILCFYYTI